MEIRRYAEIFQRRKWVIVLTAVVALAVAALGSYWMTPAYSATAVVRVAATGNAPLSYTELTYAERLMTTYSQLLRSRPYLEETVRRLNLELQPETLERQVKVETLANSELIRISVESASPTEAAETANMLATLLVEQGQEAYSGQGARTQEFLREQLAAVEERLRQDRATLAELSQRQVAVGQSAPPPDLSAKILDLNAGIRFEELTYARLLEQYERARVEEATRTNNISVVESAAIPRMPARPRPALYLPLGLLIGLVGGLGLAFLFENLDTTIHSMEELETLARVPLLGWIPAFAVRSRSKNGGSLTHGGGSHPAGESFRLLSANLLALAARVHDRGSAPTKTLLIASAESRAGRSTVLAHLAVAMARAGRRVVMVDGDLDNPRLHHLFNLPNEVGLCDAILDPRDLDVALQETKIRGLRLLSSGRQPSLDLLGSSRMQEVIQKLAEEADVVLLDSPPALASADVALLAPLADGVVLVAARGQSTGRDLELTARLLERAGGRLLGVVFNRAKGGGGDPRRQGTIPAKEKIANGVLRLQGTILTRAKMARGAARLLRTLLARAKEDRRAPRLLGTLFTRAREGRKGALRLRETLLLTKARGEKTGAPRPLGTIPANVKEGKEGQKLRAELAAPVAGARDRTLYLWIKRGLDIALSFAVLTLLSPLLLLIALLIKLDSPGPVIFAQERIGYDWRRRRQRTFAMYKFRSMVQNADQSLHQQYIRDWIRGQKGGNGSGGHGELLKLTNDPRVTRVGRLLRKTSLDELPQLWNVLKGDMSLVGPRPVPTYEVAEYQPWHKRRLKATPGITCLWQVKGRGLTNIEEMVRMDLEYIANQSIWLDLKILLLTVPVVLSGRGAA